MERPVQTMEHSTAFLNQSFVNEESRRAGTRHGPLQAICLPADLPVTRIEWIRLLALHVAGEIVPDGGERKDFVTVDDHPARDAEWPINRENFTWRTRNHLTLEPPVLCALASVELPHEVRGDSAEIANQDIAEIAVAKRATHRRACSQLVF